MPPYNIGMEVVQDAGKKEIKIENSDESSWEKVQENRNNAS